MTRSCRTTGCWIVAFAVLSSPSWSQCPPSEQDLNTLVSQLIARSDSEVAESVEAAVAMAPLQAAASTQNSAPSSSASSLSLVDGVGFSDLLGLALDNDVVSGDGNAFTLNLNAFVLAALFEPQNYWDQSRYEQRQNRWARRFGVTLSVGGAGESFDRDGDGENDQALEAQELDDIITWEARWRFYGSRDRRDDSNFAEFSGVAESLPQLLDLKGQLLARVPALSFDPDGCSTMEEVQQAIDAVPAAADLLPHVRASYARLKKSYDLAARGIDKRMIWTLVVGGTSRRDQFGPDKDMAAIRGAWGANTVNIEWNRTESLTGDDDPEMLKLGWELAKQILKGSLGKDGARLSGTFAYETFDNVPDAMHDTNVKLNTKLEIPVTETIKVPLSLTWANHADLITDEDDISGHFGVTFDTSALWKSLFGGGAGSP